MSRPVGNGWRVSADGSFAFKRGEFGTVTVSGTVRRSLRKRRRVNAERMEVALAAFSFLFRVDP
jgi:hypothetical protein